MRIAVLLTVYNRKEKTLRCLELVNRQLMSDDMNIDIYLTEDNCTDGTPEAIRAQHPEVHLIHGDGSLFWNRGMYAAWKEASNANYDFYLWLNDDTFIIDDCVLRLIEESKRYGDKSIIVGSTCAIDNPKEITYGGWQNEKLITDITSPQWCDKINGNIVLIPKYVYNKLGTNDPYFRHSLGDMDYGLRARKNNVLCHTGIGIYGKCDLHEHPTIWKDASKPFLKRYRNFISPLGNNPFEFFYFKRKHYGTIPACLTFISNWIHFLMPFLWKNKRIKEFAE